MRWIRIQPLDSVKSDNKWFITVIFFALLMLTLFVDPRSVSFLNCNFHEATGYSCPTCGLSRSFYATAHLNISEAFNYHLLGPVFYGMVFFVFGKSTLELILKKEIKFWADSIIIKILLIILFSAWLWIWITKFISL